MDGYRKCVSPKPLRVWMVYLAVHELVRGEECSGAVLRVLVGHILNPFLLNRPSMSSFCSLWGVISTRLYQVTVLPQEVIDELLVCAALCLVVKHNANRRMVRKAFMPDASVAG